MSTRLKDEPRKLEPTAMVELFEIDLSEMGDTDSPRYFYAGVDGQKNPIVFDGRSYLPVPLEASGFF